MKTNFTKLNFNSEGQLWFDVNEFKDKYEISDSDYIGKPPKIIYKGDPLSVITLESEEG